MRNTVNKPWDHVSKRLIHLSPLTFLHLFLTEVEFLAACATEMENGHLVLDSLLYIKVKEGLEKGRVESLQEPIISFVRLRFPGVENLVQQRVQKIRKEQDLKTLMNQLFLATDETSVLRVLAATAA